MQIVKLRYFQNGKKKVSYVQFLEIYAGKHYSYVLSLGKLGGGDIQVHAPLGDFTWLRSIQVQLKFNG